jgi:dTDP-4-amino-4,6-dideoxygalactose transaminase
MACHLLNLKNGDEVIVPSYTFSSTANAVIAAGGTPVFADVSMEGFTMGLSEIKMAISPRTKAIIAVNYAGNGDSLAELASFCQKNQLILIEDNAHGLGGKLENKTVGTFGDISTLSFHATKNLTCGEGGALIVNNSDLIEQAYLLRDKGTNRRQFMLGQADKYTWHSFGSSYGLNDVSAAILKGQLERITEIQTARSQMWQSLRTGLDNWADINNFILARIQNSYTSHIFWMLAPDLNTRNKIILHLKSNGVNATFHYVPLHSSPMGLNFRNTGCLNSEEIGARLLRLPLGSNYESDEVERIIQGVLTFSS